MARKASKLNLYQGEVLKEVIKKSGFTQKEFSEKLGYTEQYVSYLVCGKRRVSVDFVRSIMEKFPEIGAEKLLEDVPFIPLAKNGFWMKKSYFDAINYFEDNDRLFLYDALFAYVFDGTEPQTDNPLCSVLRLIVEFDGDE